MPEPIDFDAAFGVTANPAAAQGIDFNAAFAPQRSEPGVLEAFGRGAAQGATLNFSDEIIAGAKALGITPTDYVAAVATGGVFAPSLLLPKAIGTLIGNGPSGVLDAYRLARADERQANEAAAATQPIAYGAGQVTGGIGAAAALPVVGPTTLLGTALTGAGYGAAAGLGESTADVTQGELRQSAADATLGGAVGGVAGAATKAIASAAGAGFRAVRKALPGGEQAAVERAAKEAAAAVAKDAGVPLASDFSQPVGGFFKRSMELQAMARKVPGAEDFEFRPSQATHYPDLAAAEQNAAQFQATMRLAQSAEAKQTRQSAFVLDSLTNKVAARPEDIGRTDIGAEITKGLEKYMEDKAAERSAVTRPLYAQYERLAGKSKQSTDFTVEALRKEIEKLGQGAASGAAGKLRMTLSALEEGATVKNMIAERQFWSEASHVNGTVLDELGSANKRRIAAEIVAAIDNDLDLVSGVQKPKAVAAYREANRLYKEYSDDIKNAATQTVGKILNLGETDATDTIASKLLSSSENQIRGVFRVLNQSAPETARQTRAEMFEALFNKAGKPKRAAAISQELGLEGIQYGRAFSELKKNETKMLAAVEGDPAALDALKTTFEFVNRLRFGPGYKGSQTAFVEKPGTVAESTTSAVKELMAEIPGVSAARKTAKILAPIFSDNGSLAKAVSTPEGTRAFNQALFLNLAEQRGASIPDAVIRSLSATLANVGVTGLAAANTSKPANKQIAKMESNR